MPAGSHRIAVLGGVPPSLGGGGLELQIEQTMAALSARGHEVFHVAREPVARPFDVLHAFGSEPDVFHLLSHWRRSPAPLVVSPVIPATVGAEELLLRVASRVPLLSLAQRMRAVVVRRGDVVVALTDEDAALVRRLGAARVEVIPNGVDAGVAGAVPEGLPDRFALLLGRVTKRKGQAEVIAAVRRGGGLPCVVAGGWEGPPADREAFAAAVAATGGTWLGEVEPAVARGLLQHASALVHVSSTEVQSLAVLEALAEATPVVASSIPSHRDLAARHPGWIRLVDDADAVPAALAALDASAASRGARPQVPTWDDVAASLEAVYASL